ncbi:hypothetical protein [Flavobacterium columnare]|uniref:hypothetical protein n=1 Tax=Flavobacterium columnare TaxID=996 RepID=UPI002989EDE1|nr:hypothetical protein [Flavobacterium columnare]MCH4828213.1 hypothetical protein [Flavobacterium columnare]
MFGGNYSLSGKDILSAGLDIVGIFDPTGISDAVGAKMAFDDGDYFSAAISAVGVILCRGFSKVGKIKKDINIIENAIDAVKICR